MMSPELEMVYLFNVVPMITGAVYFALDYQALKSTCDSVVLQAKRSSLDDCRQYFLRNPSFPLEYTKIVYSRMIFDIIGIFYDPHSISKESEMLLCATWSLIIFLYILVCQKVVFMCMLLGYIVHQCYLVLTNRATFQPAPLSDEYCRGKYELLKASCSGHRQSFDTLMQDADKGEHVSAGFVIFILTSNESNIEPDMQKATSVAHENLDLFMSAAKGGGDIFAQATLSFLFMRGIHVPKDDAKALHYGLQAVRTDHPFAHLILGWVYLARAKREPELAYKHLKLAAKQGLASAQNSMGALNLLDNDKYKQNPRQALYWFKQAALQNLRGAEYNLGALYNSDILIEGEREPSFFSFGARKSLSDVKRGLRNDAVYWLMLASQHGHRLADAELRKAEHRLNSL